MDAEREDERRLALEDVPLAAITDRQAGEVSGKSADIPCGALTACLDVTHPARRLLDHPLPHAREVTQRDAHAAGGAWGAEPIDGYIRAVFTCERLPYMLTHELGVRPAGCAFD